MNHHEYTWETGDKLLLYAQSWMPDNAPRAVIDIVHGFKDHSGRFEKWALRLVQEGYGVVAVDLRGHGRSQGRRGYADSFSRYLGDVEVLCNHSHEMFGAAGHVLYGHSLGGNIVTNYLVSRNHCPSAAVITSPWFSLAFKPSLFRVGMAYALRYLMPGMVVNSDLDAGGLSHNPEVIESYRKDPLVHNKILPRLFLEIVENGLRASRSIYKINIPMLVMHGSEDPITSVKQTRSFVLHAGLQTTYREWPGCFHELHNDFRADEVFSLLTGWLNQQFPG